MKEKKKRKSQSMIMNKPHSQQGKGNVSQCSSCWCGSSCGDEQVCTKRLVKYSHGQKLVIQGCLPYDPGSYEKSTISHVYHVLPKAEIHCHTDWAIPFCVNIPTLLTSDATDHESHSDVRVTLSPKQHMISLTEGSCLHLYISFFFFFFIWPPCWPSG